MFERLEQEMRAGVLDEDREATIEDIRGARARMWIEAESIGIEIIEERR